MMLNEAYRNAGELVFVTSSIFLVVLVMAAAAGIYVHFAHRGTPVSLWRAKRIMGGNFLGFKDAMRYFCPDLSADWRCVFESIPFTAKALKRCRKTHMLVAVLPVSLAHIEHSHPLVFRDISWCEGERFARDRASVGWHLVRREFAELSENASFPGEELPSARVLAYAIVFRFLLTGERLYERTFAPTSVLDSHGNRILVGGFEGGRLAIVPSISISFRGPKAAVADILDDSARAAFGSPSARKPPLFRD